MKYNLLFVSILLTTSALGQQYFSRTVCETKETIVKTMGYATVTVQRCTTKGVDDKTESSYYEFVGLERAGNDHSISHMTPSEAKEFGTSLSKLLSLTVENPKTTDEFYTLSNQAVSIRIKADKYAKWEYSLDYNLKSVRLTTVNPARKELEHLNEYLSKVN